MTKKNTPSLTVESSIKQNREPDWIDISVDIKGSASDRVEAYRAFESQLNDVKAVTDGLGDIVAEVKVDPSRERTEEIDKAFKKAEVFHVTSQATIRIGKSAGLGATLAALVSAGLTFDDPSFVYPDTPEIQPEQLEIAAAGARKKAEACARGAGCQLGNVISIRIPQSHENMRLKPASNFFASVDLFSLKMPTFNAMEARFPTYEDEFKVIVTYELVSA